MSTDPKRPADRRQQARVAAAGKLQATVIDDNNQPLVVLRDVEVVNVSAGGLCILTSTDVVPASIVSALVGDPQDAEAQKRRLKLEVLECAPQHDRRYRVRCRLIEGAIPAQLMYDWFAGHSGPVPA